MMKRKKNQVKEQARRQEILQLLRRYYPEAQCALYYQNPLQLLIATILSAQCTDKRVNQVTPLLFSQYPEAIDLAKADLNSLEKIIRPTGFFRSKALHIKKACEILVKKFASEIPRDLSELIQLPGVGRKTANVVLGNAFGIVSGVVVDTHVKRLSHRLQLVDQAIHDPEKIEAQLIKWVPSSDWIQFSHWLIEHGRNVCRARQPQCDRCFLFEHCPTGKSESLTKR